MKRYLPQLGACVLVLAVLTSLTAPLAVAGPTIVHAEGWQNWISVENVTWTAFLDDQGLQRPKLQYNGSVYIPLRTAAEWIGATAEWDQKRQTVTLTSGGEPAYLGLFDPAGEPEMTAEQDAQYLQELLHGADAVLLHDLTVLLDGAKQKLTNARGKPVYPLTVRGCVYLPVRSVAEMCHMQILFFPAWGNGDENQIFIYKDITSAQQAAALDYFADCAKEYATIRVAVDKMDNAQGMSDALFYTSLAELKAQVLRIQDRAWPEVPILEYNCNTIRSLCRNLVSQSIDVYMDMEFMGVAFTSENRREDFIISSRDTMRLLQDMLEWSDHLLNATLHN